MIFISSSCVKQNRIADAVSELVGLGFKKIELSGGTEYYTEFESELIALKEEHSLNYVCHNYFPPPKEHFVLNLSSSNEAIYNNSIALLSESIQLSKKFNSSFLAFHAGFLSDVNPSQIGKSITFESLASKEESIERFIAAHHILNEKSDGVKLYVENNVLSATNYKNAGNKNPFLLTTYQDYVDLKSRFEFNLLLDIAHLKVTCKTLGLNFEEQLNLLLPHTDYLHLSDNDGLTDSNEAICDDSELYKLLRQHNLNNKNITLEINDFISLTKNYELIFELL